MDASLGLPAATAVTGQGFTQHGHREKAEILKRRDQFWRLRFTCAYGVLAQEKQRLQLARPGVPFRLLLNLFLSLLLLFLILEVLR